MVNMRKQKGSKAASAKSSTPLSSIISGETSTIIPAVILHKIQDFS